MNVLTEKTTLVDNDIGVIEDSEATNAKKKFKLSSVWTYIKSKINFINLNDVNISSLTVGKTFQVVDVSGTPKIQQVDLLAKTPITANTTFTVGGNRATAVSIVNAGTGYTANDILICQGGTGSPTYIKVLTVDVGGEILTAEVNRKGCYTANPTNPVSVTGGTGSDATFDLIIEEVERDYDEIADACYDVYNKYYPKAVAGGITVEIKCLSGYIMKKPLHIRQGVDMGFIVITGEDTVVKINPESWANDTTRAFYGYLNTTLPTLSVKFDMEGKQNSASQNVDGLMVTYSSKAVIADGNNSKGIINCSGRGVYAYINSEVDMNRTVVSSTTTDAVVAERGSKISAGQTSATHGGSGVGYRVVTGSIIYTRNGTGFSGTVSQTVNTVTGSGIIFQ